MRRPWLALLLLLHACGEPSPSGSLLLNVRTDLLPGVEFTGAVARLGVLTRERIAQTSDDFVAGVQMPVFESLEAGAVEVEVELIDASGVVARRQMFVMIRDGEPTSATIVLTRGAGSDAGSPEDAGSASDAGSGDAGLGDGGGSDAGSIADAGTLDAGAPSPVIGIGPDRTSLTPANFACAGIVTAPSESGPTAAFTGIVTDFQNAMPIEGLTVEVFAAGPPALTCGSGCVSRTSDPSGAVSLTDVPGSWLAYRQPGGTGSIEGEPREYAALLRYGNVAPSVSGTVELTAIQESTVDVIIALLGVSRTPGTAVILGPLLDCDGEAVANATVRVFDASGEVALDFGRTGPRELYFNGSGVPAASERSTHVDGLFGAANLPIGASRRVRVELWGSMGAAPVLLGCEAVDLVPDGVTILDVGPRRADGPADCSP